jgi:hypothetical protein
MDADVDLDAEGEDDDDNEEEAEELSDIPKDKLDLTESQVNELKREIGLNEAQLKR